MHFTLIHHHTVIYITL